MTKPTTEKQMRRKTNAPPYSVAWIVIGAIGLGYLGIAFLAPSLLPDLSGGRSHVSEAAILKVTAEVETLKSSVSKLELDVASTKSDMSTQTTDMQKLSAQVTELDDKVRLAQAPVSAGANTAQVAEAPPAMDAASASAAEPSTPPPAKIINGPRVGAPIETGSVEGKHTDQTISFGPAVVKPAAKAIGVQIATDTSVDGLRVTWGALSQIHSDQLSQLSARYADIGTATSPSYGLIAGPIKSRADARKVCKELAAQSVTCKVSEFKGEAL
jgi:outer membrane murein-binding lipoprotein Lpp